MSIVPEGDSYVHHLLEQLMEIEERLIPTGLHVLDRPFEPAELEDVVSLAAEFQPPEAVRPLRDRLASCKETNAVARALSGEYVVPAPGGDVIRNPSVVPTGRNVHGLNPAMVPSAVALRGAQRTTGALLERALQETGALPESVGLVLWGTDNLKTDGE
ncbi:MAG: cobaltochelatase subunit CobN, partial [Chloroflexota bacterium]|nr:cobaltochelatase subunit CobN [Chloroflexota bacterium]